MVDQDIIDGLLLGDASIHPKRDMFSFAQAGREKEDFVFMVRDILYALGFEPRLNQTVRRSDGLFVSTVWTRSSLYWALCRHRFYPNGKKVIPQDVLITPKSMFMFYLCDGSLGWAHGRPWSIGSSPWLELATCSFSLDDIMFLGNSLKKLIGLSKFSVKTADKYPKLCITSRANTSSFFEFILQGNKVPHGYEYKFRGFYDISKLWKLMDSLVSGQGHRIKQPTQRHTGKEPIREYC